MNRWLILVWAGFPKIQSYLENAGLYDNVVIRRNKYENSQKITDFCCIGWVKFDLIFQQKYRYRRYKKNLLLKMKIAMARDIILIPNLITTKTTFFTVQNLVLDFA